MSQRAMDGNVRAWMSHTYDRVDKRVRREMRRAARIVGPTRLGLFYHVGYRVPDSDIVDARRAERVIAYLLKMGWVPHAGGIRVPEPISLRQLLRIHDIDYLEHLDDPRVVAAILGGDFLSFDDTRSVVSAQRWATAGTVAAAKWIQKRGRGARAMNLGGGFHHAHAARGEGFCCFNDVAVAIAELRASGFDKPILVVDLDLHHGNGTKGIFASDESVFTLSVHAEHWDHLAAIQNLDVRLGTAVGDVTYLDAVKRSLAEVLASFEPALCFYVAGVDVAAEDKLGSWMVSADGILARDRIVLDELGDVPVLITMAGGYGSDAWRHHARLAAYLIGQSTDPIPSGVERSLAAFRAIASTLRSAELARDDEDDFAIREEDVYGDLVEKRPEARILGFYTDYGIELAFERYGLLPHLRKRGYAKPWLEIDPDCATGQALRIYGDATRRALLVELVIRTTREFPPHTLLFVEWLLAQDPRREATRPLLPGQDYPGLGCLPILVGILIMACERLQLDGLCFVPAHYHVAAQARGELRFLNPEDEARFLLMAEALAGRTLLAATLAVTRGEVVDATSGEVMHWEPAPMVLAVSVDLRAELESSDYAKAVERAADGRRFVVTSTS